MSAPADDLNAIKKAARDLSYQQLEAQFQSKHNSIQALRVVTCDGAALAAIVAPIGLSWDVASLGHSAYREARSLLICASGRAL